MTADVIVMEITMIEEFHLARLVDDLIGLVGAARNPDDPALARLTPSPYPDDPDAAAQFAETTKKDLYDRRLTEARNVRAQLAEFGEGIDSLTHEAALTTRELLIAPENIEIWLRTLTALRLVIATRIGIDFDAPVGESGHYDVYDWLGYRLEVLIQSADDVDVGTEG